MVRKRRAMGLGQIQGGILHAALRFHVGEEVGAGGGEAEEAVAAGGVERLVEVGEGVALPGGAGLGGVGGEVRGHGVVAGGAELGPLPE